MAPDRLSEPANSDHESHGTADPPRHLFVCYLNRENVHGKKELLKKGVRRNVERLWFAINAAGN
jgi:hypothetical protein